jgi:hypothetical protein
MRTCDRCGKTIAGTSADPIHVTSRGTHHAACMRAAWAEVSTAKEERTAAVAEVRSRRAEAARARWAAMTVEQRAARVASMHAGRREARS